MLNLIASGRPIGELSEAVGLRFGVVEQAADEVQWLDPETPDAPREHIDLSALYEEGSVQRLALEAGELDRFVALARELGDGEAATLALAEARSLSVATDDRKARRVLTVLDPQPEITGTASIMQAWSSGRRHEEISTALGLIEVRASFVPPNFDAASSWWRNAVGPSG
jgi:hypothetical protein